MSTLTFKALIGAVHIDPKKGTVKIQLEATSYVSVDELTTLGPREESVRITLESEQTRIKQIGDPIIITEEGARKLKEAARKLRDSPDAREAEEEEERLKKKADGLQEQEELHVVGEADANLPNENSEAETGDMEE